MTRHGREISTSDVISESTSLVTAGCWLQTHGETLHNAMVQMTLLLQGRASVDGNVIVGRGVDRSCITRARELGGRAGGAEHRDSGPECLGEGAVAVEGSGVEEEVRQGLQGRGWGCL